MWRDCFWDWRTGTLGRRAYANRLVALALLWLALFLLGMVAAASIADAFGGGVGARNDWAERLAGADLILCLAGWANLVMKRGRDIGLSGRASAGAFVLLMVMGGAPVLLTLLLVLVPPDLIGPENPAGVLKPFARPRI